MKHGQEISREQRTTYGESQTWVDATTGETVYQGPVCAKTETIRLVHCDNCGPVEIDFFGLIIHYNACPKCSKEWKLS